MDINNLYPTRTTLNVGETSGQYQVELTSGWGSTYDGETVNDISSYWLGWIRPENAPVEPCVGYYKDHGQTSETLTFETISDKQNCPCGYVNNSTTNYNDCERRILKQTVDGVETFNADSTYALYNQNYAMYSGRAQSAVSSSGYILSLGLKYCVYNAGNELIDPATHIEPGSINLNCGTDSMRGFKTWQFLQGNYDIPITKTYDGVTYTFMFNRDVLETGTGYIQDTTGTISMRFFIYDVSLYGGVGMNGTSTSNVHPEFVYEISGTFGTHTCKYLSVGAGYPRWGNTYQEMYFEYDYRNNFPTEEDPRIRLGGLHGHFTATQLTAIRSDWDTPFVWDGNVFAYRHLQSGSGYYPQFRRVYSMSDIDKMYAYMYRMDVGSSRTAGYVANITYATNVLPSNEFLAEYKTGNLTDPIYKNGLRDWQYNDFQSDDFTPEDIPPYTPPGPDPRPDPEPPEDDAEHGGDDIEPTPVTGLGGTFGFTTQYAMRGNQLEQLGSALWAGFDRNNPDIDAFIQNFVYSVDPDTGSVNMADIMEFFISLRAYPMPLGNLTSITSVGTDFYIGSGTAPLRLPNGTTPFTENLHTADSYIEPVNAGTVSVPFWFGDYRDYKTEITLYLPYCGTAELNPADVMGCTLDCTYVVDLSTGSCTAYVWTTTWENRRYPVAILPGQLGVDIPITATNAGRVGARLLGDRINFAENIMSVLKNTATGIGAVTSGNIGTGIRATMSAFIDPAIQEQKQLAGMADRGAIAAPMLSGGRGLAAFRNPATAYVQVRSPYYAVPEKYADTVGDPAATRVQIRDCHGFNQFVNVDVSGITTDAADQAEIRRALENGIYI